MLTLALSEPETILEIVRDPSMATMTLVEVTQTRITDTDTAEVALEQLRSRIFVFGFADRKEAQNVDMVYNSANEHLWDMVWSESSAYILAVEKAFADWRALPRHGDALLGGIFFTCRNNARDPRAFFMIAPLAVASERQGEGIGQRLVACGHDTPC
ncbi:hypothetical protein [Ruegeria sp. HKCCA5491]|uniref:hypothetical protein n=1 Tax=Ruegeria sp. HKCCA5491 TaxID=2682986 RepID=UPI001487B5C4|nr:hypothetical protein [Ruegeria sp. HKCCA5491]